MGEGRPGIGARRGWSQREGKRFLYEVGLLCNVISAVCVFMAFCSPYWIMSWPRVHSGFKRIGLWEACFAGMVLETDPAQKSYHGCWWILAPEFKDITGWLMPWWFVLTQVLFTFVFIGEMVGTAVILVLWIQTGRTQRDVHEKRKAESLAMLQTGVAITVSVMIVKTANMVLFAGAFYLDRHWLPLPEFNYLSWSYGLALVSCFLSIFATIAQVTYALIVRQERREPPKDVSMSGYLSAPSNDTSFSNHRVPQI